MIPATARRLVSRVDGEGRLELRIRPFTPPAPGERELLVRIDGAPLNPADLRAMLCGVAPATLVAGSDGEGRFLRGQVAPAALPGLAARAGRDVATGIEGTGIVVATGSDPAARHLLGRRVAAGGAGTFADCCTVGLDECIALDTGQAPEAAAAGWINPMTALAMIETARGEGHRALVLTAAASSLGLMLARACREDGIAMVGIVRSQPAADLLRSAGATHVCDSSSAGFERQLEQALAATGARLAFDATGGGSLAGTLLATMERVASAAQAGYSPYGSGLHKQVYFFGGLDPEPVTFRRNFGMAWGMGGWLMQPVLARLGRERVEAMKERVRNGLQTTFATAFGGTMRLEEMLVPERLTACARFGTGAKHMVTP